MTTYEKVNDEVWHARRNHLNRGYELFVLMCPATFYRYMETMPPDSGYPGRYPDVQGCQVIRANVEGFMLCRGV